MRKSRPRGIPTPAPIVVFAEDVSQDGESEGGGVEEGEGEVWERLAIWTEPIAKTNGSVQFVAAPQTHGCCIH